jgi:hypothetical protein
VLDQQHAVCADAAMAITDLHSVLRGQAERWTVQRVMRVMRVINDDEVVAETLVLAE